MNRPENLRFLFNLEILKWYVTKNPNEIKPQLLLEYPSLYVPEKTAIDRQPFSLNNLTPLSMK